MPKDCLYCSLQFSETTGFCPNCGRPTESGFRIHPIQEKDSLIRRLVLTLTTRATEYAPQRARPVVVVPATAIGNGRA